MIEMRTILAATDFSEHGENAVRYAAALARAYDAELVLCHVVESESLLAQVPPGGEGYFPPNMAKLHAEQARENCNAQLAEANVPRGRVVITQGTPFVEIVRLAKSEQADLVVVGTHGRGAIAHILLGSVAEKIIQKCPCPVLTVRAEEHEFVLP